MLHVAQSITMQCLSVMKLLRNCTWGVRASSWAGKLRQTRVLAWRHALYETRENLQWQIIPFHRAFTFVWSVFKPTVFLTLQCLYIVFMPFLLLGIWHGICERNLKYPWDGRSNDQQSFGWGLVCNCHLQDDLLRPCVPKSISSVHVICVSLVNWMLFFKHTVSCHFIEVG